MLFERHAGLPGLRICGYGDDLDATIDLPEAICAIEPGTNLEFESETYRFWMSSLALPECGLRHPYSVAGVDSSKAPADTKRFCCG